MIDHSTSRRSGFTLIELSIVLVIIGLVIGGVLVGRDLIRAAEIRSVMTEVERYGTAINAFRIKYNGIPGDLVNATDFWGAADPDPSTCHTTQGNGTCNGDGDGFILNAYEWWRSWQQLSLAGLIAGQYTGVAGPNSVLDAVIGTNVPGSRYPSGGYTLYSAGTLGGPNYFPGEYGHILYFGSDTPQYTYGALMTNGDAAILDIKMDDGKPGTGKVRTTNATSGNGCANSDDANSATYTPSDPNIHCQMLFLMGF